VNDQLLTLDLVIAQELEQVMPNAVKHVGDVNLNGREINDFLVVNERVLLYENILY
jgi:hypothetical protein